MMSVPRSASEIADEWSSNHSDGMLHIHTPVVDGSLTVVAVPPQKYDVVIYDGNKPVTTLEGVLIRLDCLPTVLIEFDNGGKLIYQNYDFMDVSPHEGE